MQLQLIGRAHSERGTLAIRCCGVWLRDEVGSSAERVSCARAVTCARGPLCLVFVPKARRICKTVCFAAVRLVLAGIARFACAAVIGSAESTRRTRGANLVCRRCRYCVQVLACGTRRDTPAFTVVQCITVVKYPLSVLARGALGAHAVRCRGRERGRVLRCCARGQRGTLTVRCRRRRGCLVLERVRAHRHGIACACSGQKISGPT